MMYISATVIALLISMIIVHRYLPVYGLKQLEMDDFVLNGSSMGVDVRQYHTASRTPVDGSMNIPLAYLKRNWREVNSSHVIVIASDRVELNISAKLLKRKGCFVEGYILMNDQPCTAADQGTAGIGEFCKDSCGS